MARRKALPALPKEIHSSLGTIPVTECDKLAEKKGAFGVFNFQQRTIKIDSGAAPETKWQTLFHEATHVALWDAGCDNSLTDKQTEIVCDAVGTFFASMVRAGVLKFAAPRKKKE